MRFSVVAQQPLVAKPSTKRVLHVVDANSGRIARSGHDGARHPTSIRAGLDLRPQKKIEIREN
jgi:hypothetical protein